MARITAEATRLIPAPAATAYAILADYVDGHPRILPAAFSGLVVERGGYGAGTEIRFNATMFGQTSELRAVVEEPDPGRVLTERYPATGMLTTFTVEPTESGRECRVRIHTSYEASGISGAFQRLLVPSLLRRIFRDELANLERDCVGSVSTTSTQS